MNITFSIYFVFVKVFCLLTIITWIRLKKELRQKYGHVEFIKKLSSIITLYSMENSSNVYRYLFLNFSLIKYLIINSKDTNRKIRKTDLICGFKNGSSNAVNTGEVWGACLAWNLELKFKHSKL